VSDFDEFGSLQVRKDLRAFFYFRLTQETSVLGDVFEEGIGQGGSEGVDAVCVWFPMGVGEVAE